MPIAHYGSIVPDLVDSVRRDLQAGVWTANLPSERELCERFHVSRPTLRKALALLKQERLIRSEPGSGWRVEKTSQSATSSTVAKPVGILCFVSLGKASPSTLLNIDKLQEHLTHAGIKVHVHDGDQYGSQNYRQALSRLISECQPSVWVLVSSNGRIQRWFQEQHIPFFDAITACRSFRFPSIFVDMQLAYREALGLLIQRGHDRIAFLLLRERKYLSKDDLPLSTDQPAGKLEMELYRLARKWGVNTRVVLHDGTSESACKAISMQMKMRQPPTAFVVARPKHALTAITYLMRSGLRVPEDVSVISIGHQSFLNEVIPTMAHFAINQEAFVRKLCRMVVPWAKSGFWTPKGSTMGMEFHDGESLGTRAATSKPAF